MANAYYNMYVYDLLICFFYLIYTKLKKVKKTVDIVKYIWYIINALEKDAKEIVL